MSCVIRGSSLNVLSCVLGESFVACRDLRPGNRADFVWMLRTGRSWYQAEWLGDAWVVDGGFFLLRVVLAFERRD